MATNSTEGPLFRCRRHFQVRGTATSNEYQRLGTESNLRPRTRARSTVHRIEQDPFPAVRNSGKRRDAKIRRLRAGNEKMDKPQTVRPKEG